MIKRKKKSKEQIEENRLETTIMHNKMYDWWFSFGYNKKCEACSIKLPYYFSTLNVHHLLPKSKYKDVKLDSKYWMLLCQDCHSKWENYPIDVKIIERTEIAKNNYMKIK